MEPLEECRRLIGLGLGDREVARSLNARNVPTVSGRGIWHPSRVSRVRNPEPFRRYMRNYMRRRRG